MCRGVGGSIKHARVLTRPLDLPHGNVSLREVTFDTFFLTLTQADTQIKARKQAQAFTHAHTPTGMVFEISSVKIRD